MNYSINLLSENLQFLKSEIAVNHRRLAKAMAQTEKEILSAKIRRMEKNIADLESALKTLEKAE